MSRPPKPLIDRKMPMGPSSLAVVRARARTGDSPGDSPRTKEQHLRANSVTAAVPRNRRAYPRRVARVARQELGGGLGHVTSRTIRRLPLFLNERDGLALLSLLDHVTRDVAEWDVLAYCLMPNHFHLVLDADVDQLSLGMHRVNGVYAQRFNREHGFTGHLFQARFHLKPIRDEAHLPGSIRYVLLNPVRAGLCRRPEEWRWSSYRASVGLAAAPPFLALSRLLACFGVEPGTARGSLRSFVEAALANESMGTVPGTVPDDRQRAAA
jgi:putative transposase